MSFTPITSVWILARPKVKYYGAYPAGFLLRARDMLGCNATDQVVHVCGGCVRDYKCGPGCTGRTHYHGLGEHDVTVDLDPLVKPDVLADVRLTQTWMALKDSCPNVRAVLADPPYNPEYATHYNVGPEVLPTPGKIVHHAVLDLLPVGGRVGVLSMEWPRYPKTNARQIAIIGVVVGNGNIGRWFSVYERTK